MCYYLVPKAALRNGDEIFLSLQVKEYCPLVFRNLRERFGIDDASYLKSLTKAPLPMEPPLGKSQAKFYTSQDHIYMIRTMSSEEVEQTHCILNAYHPYVVERRGKTLLPQMLVRSELRIILSSIIILAHCACGQKSKIVIFTMFDNHEKKNS